MHSQASHRFGIASLLPCGARFWAVLALAMTTAWCAGAKPAEKTNRPATGIPYEGLSAGELKALVGAEVDVVPRTGKTFKLAELVQAAPGKQSGTLQSIGFKPAEGGAKRSLPAKSLARLVVGATVYEVMPDPRQKNAFLLVDLARRDALVSTRLKELNEKLWPPMTDDERSEAVEENKALLKKIDNAVPDRHFELTETQYYLFCTDVPKAAFAPVIADLDNMYLTLGRKFGVYEGENIWHGKAMIAIFSTQKYFANFEKIVMQVDDVHDYQAYFHRLDKGDVLCAGHVSDNPSYLLSVLIHDTARGYMHRYRSTVEPPTWIREGVAEWVTGNILATDKSFRRSQELAVEHLRNTSSLAGLFKAKQFNTSWQWGAASGMTDILLKTDALAFRQLVQGVKEGQTWQEALQDAFGMSGEDLAQLYGQQIGVPNLRP